MFTAPGAKHSELKCDGLLSSFAFRFSLRRYTKAAREEEYLADMHGVEVYAEYAARQGGHWDNKHGLLSQETRRLSINLSRVNIRPGGPLTTSTRPTLNLLLLLLLRSSVWAFAKRVTRALISVERLFSMTILRGCRGLCPAWRLSRRCSRALVQTDGHHNIT
jgi:hypothetical protein